MKLPNGITTDKEILVAADWNYEKVHCDDGVNKTIHNDLPEAAQAYPNSLFVLELTSDSYDTKDRQKTLKAFAENNIEARGPRSQATARHREERGIKDKSHFIDAGTLRDMALTTKRSLSRFKEIVKKDKLGDKISKFLIHDRCILHCKKTLKLAYKYLKDYPPEYEDFMLDSDGNYRKSLGRFVYVALQVRKAGLGHHTFERMIGNNGNGYPRMIRAEFYHWLTECGVTKKRLKAAGETVRKRKKGDKEKGEKDEKVSWWGRLTPSQRDIHKTALKDADKFLRWIWDQTA